MGPIKIVSNYETVSSYVSSRERIKPYFFILHHKVVRLKDVIRLSALIVKTPSLMLSRILQQGDWTRLVISQKILTTLPLVWFCFFCFMVVYDRKKNIKNQTDKKITGGHGNSINAQKRKHRIW